MSAPEDVQAVPAAKLAVLFPHPDERQRRLSMGVEARSRGHGGIRLVARAADVREADDDPGLRPALPAVVEPDGRGDPMSPLRRTTRSTRRPTAKLAPAEHRISADTVADLLGEGGSSL